MPIQGMDLGKIFLTAQAARANQERIKQLELVNKFLPQMKKMELEQAKAQRDFNLEKAKTEAAGRPFAARKAELDILDKEVGIQGDLQTQQEKAREQAVRQARVRSEVAASILKNPGRQADILTGVANVYGPEFAQTFPQQFDQQTLMGIQESGQLAFNAFQDPADPLKEQRLFEAVQQNPELGRFIDRRDRNRATKIENRIGPQGGVSGFDKQELRDIRGKVRAAGETRNITQRILQEYDPEVFELMGRLGIEAGDTLERFGADLPPDLKEKIRAQQEIVSLAKINLFTTAKPLMGALSQEEAKAAQEAFGDPLKSGPTRFLSKVKAIDALANSQDRLNKGYLRDGGVEVPGESDDLPPEIQTRLERAKKLKEQDPDLSNTEAWEMAGGGG